jgi:hypothetical protein
VSAHFKKGHYVQFPGKIPEKNALEPLQKMRDASFKKNRVFA